MNVIFMGTPEFSVPILDEISKKHNISLVVTQPDTYNIKKKEMVYSPVKKWALDHDVKVFQPEKIRLDYDTIINTPCDIIVTAAYGQIVPTAVLDYPRLKAINVHGSLLPKYRGGAPIQRAIINGDKETGITIMYMAPKMDAGDILYQEKLPILDSDIQDTIFSKLSLLAASFINDVIDKLDKGELKGIPQKEEEVTFAYNLTKEDEHIDFTKSARDVFNQIRGLNSNPTGYFILDNQNIKVYSSIVKKEEICYNNMLDNPPLPSRICGINKDSFDVSCRNGSVISITEIKLPGKNKMKVKDFINGQGRKMLVIGKEIF
ncbi:MAG: methionyl-tRNA formyltransferase [Bacilli bacterium]|nr:methionyl-tRNA formyltransferase [Bacilli bacterium]